MSNTTCENGTATNLSANRSVEPCNLEAEIKKMVTDVENARKHDKNYTEVLAISWHVDVYDAGANQMRRHIQDAVRILTAALEPLRGKEFIKPVLALQKWNSHTNKLLTNENHWSMLSESAKEATVDMKTNFFSAVFSSDGQRVLRNPKELTTLISHCGHNESAVREVETRTSCAMIDVNGASVLIVSYYGPYRQYGNLEKRLILTQDVLLSNINQLRQDNEDWTNSPVIVCANFNDEGALAQHAANQDACGFELAESAVTTRHAENDENGVPQFGTDAIVHTVGTLVKKASWKIVLPQEQNDGAEPSVHRVLFARFQLTPRP